MNTQTDNTRIYVMNKPIRCTTHFHACDCREYEFEQLRKELQEKDRFILSQEKDRQRTEAFWKEKLEKLQTENAAYIKQIQDKNLSLVELIEPLTRKLDEKNAEIQKLQHQLEIQTKRVENLKKSNEFYVKTHSRELAHLDTEAIGYDKFISGKLARSCQAIDQELEKELENLK